MDNDFGVILMRKTGESQKDRDCQTWINRPCFSISFCTIQPLFQMLSTIRFGTAYMYHSRGLPDVSKVIFEDFRKVPIPLLLPSVSFDKSREAG